MYARSIPRPSFTVLLAISAISLFVIILLRPSQSATTLISEWKPPQMITKPDLPSEQANPPAPAIIGTTVAVDALDISVDATLYSNERDALHSELADALAYVTQRFGSAPSARFTAAIVSDASCGLHGIAYTDVRNVQVFTCPSISRDRAVNIMAHEMMHQLEHDRYGPPHLSSDLILSEGLATWGAGKYWLGGQPDFKTFVRKQRDAGLFYPLATHYSGLGITAMNALYYQWASFVDFLITTYGRNKFDQLYVTGHGDPGSSDYAGVYGKSLDVLEQEWKAWLDS
jgi:hypothetical protein